MKILILDNNLNYINSVRIPVPAMDFAIIPEGFLLYNLNAKENDGIIMSITTDGQLKDNYIPSDGIPDLILSQHLFTETAKGILTLPPMRNELYEYNFKNDSVNCQYKYEFSNMKSVSEGHESLPDIQNAVILAFETERYLISNFYFNQIIGTCVHDKRKNVTTSGLIKTDLPYPFTPMTTKDDILFSLCERSYISEDSPRYIILKYYLKK